MRWVGWCRPGFTSTQNPRSGAGSPGFGNIDPTRLRPPLGAVGRAPPPPPRACPKPGSGLYSLVSPDTRRAQRCLPRRRGHGTEGPPSLPRPTDPGAAEPWSGLPQPLKISDPTSVPSGPAHLTQAAQSLNVAATERSPSGGVEPLRWVGLFRSSLDTQDSRGFFPLASLGGARGPRARKPNSGPPPRLSCGTTGPWIHR